MTNVSSDINVPVISLIYYL